jgi:hypothetical protein
MSGNVASQKGYLAQNARKPSTEPVGKAVDCVA